MASVINQINIDNTNYAIAASAYAECSTAAATVAKAASIITADDTTNVDFTLIKGVSIKVKFTNSNTASNPTLNVNGTGAKSIKRYGTTAVGTSAASSWRAGAIVDFVYDGTNWVMTTGIDDNSGDITGVTAGNGLTGGGSSGSVTLNVGAGSGITVGADTVSHADTSTLEGSYGPTADVTQSAKSNASIVVPQITVDGFGHVTGVTNRTLTVTDTNTDNNTSHSHSAGVGLVGSGMAGTSGTYTYKAKLRDETALTIDSAAATTTSGRVYPVAVDKSGYLSVNVPWTNSTNFASTSHKHAYSGTTSAANAEVNAITGVGANGTATALTGVKVSNSSSAAPGGHTHSFTPTGTITLASLEDGDSGYLKYVYSITGGSYTLGGTKTFVTGVSGGSGSLASYTTSSGSTVQVSNGTRVPYIAGTLSGSTLTLNTYYLAHTHNAASSSGTGTVSLSGSSPSPVYRYIKPTFTGTSGTSGANSGTNFNAATAVASNGTATVLTGVKATSTASVATKEHTHSYSGTTGTPQ